MSKTVLGIDIGGTSIVFGKIKDLKLIQLSSIDTGAQNSADYIMKNIFQAIRKIGTADLSAIGIGSPGYIEVETGEIKLINNIPAFQNLNIKDLIEKEFNLPVFINNDANCFALGEYYFGETRKYKNVLGITLGTGVGGGVIINGKLHSGLFGGAGEFGCIPYLDGIMEKYCSGTYFKSFHHTSGKELFIEAEKGNKKAIEIFQEYGGHLGNLVTHLIYSFAPEAIVFGGSVTGGYKYFAPAVQKKIDAFPVELIRNNLHISTAKVENAGLMGAAALCLQTEK